MNLIELDRALRQLRLGGMAAVIETRLHQAQVEPMTPIDLISCLVSDELTRRSDRLLQRRQKQAQFRDSQKSLENFDFTFNKKMNRSLAFDLATGTFIAKHEDALFLGPRKPSDTLPFSRAIACCTARLTPCSMNSPRPPSMELAKSTWICWFRCPYSSSMIWGCASCR